ncbi:hypothetical protein K7X08_011791 [Anisodus acutangulus]|uniref:Major facilitator superfamily (MFS) profile domain-containing protein n=1 Tax=Anisodus acutangulus TaxID=402998 RepID=A0A9Q1MK81_9SOLA|nr:hypothetical protein K7X08_011791 [Anisodus acutangulus]
MEPTQLTFIDEKSIQFLHGRELQLSTSPPLVNIRVMSGAVLFIRDNLKISSSQVEILVGSLNVCSLIGAFASAKTSAMIGRRYTIILAATTFLIGLLLMGLSPSYPFLMAGRVVAGIGVGYSLMIAPVYTAEVSPAMTRGLLTSLPQVFINVGILLGYIFNYALAGLPHHINWRLMLGLAAVPAIGIGFGVLRIPESPQWLVMKGRVDEAKRVLCKTSENDDEADLRLEEIIKATSLVGSSTPSNWKGQGVWKELLRPSLPFHWILVAVIGINFFMQASGNDAVVAVTILMGIAKTSFCIVSALFLDNFGRRSMLLLGTIGMAISLVSADVSFFSIGLGPITWVYSSEIFPIRLRAQGSSLAVSVNRLVSGVVAMTFLTISNKITFAGTFFMLCGVVVLATIFFYFFLPETKGKSLEEIWAIFEDKKDKIVEKETIER